MYVASCTRSYHPVRVPDSLRETHPAVTHLHMVDATLANSDDAGIDGLASPDVGVLEAEVSVTDPWLTRGLPDTFDIVPYNGPCFLTTPTITSLPLGEATGVIRVKHPLVSSQRGKPARIARHPGRPAVHRPGSVQRHHRTVQRKACQPFLFAPRVRLRRPATRVGPQRPSARQCPRLPERAAVHPAFSKGAEPYSHAQFVADLEGLRQQLNLGKITILGGSYGGFIVLEYVRTHPENLHAVILRDTAASNRFEGIAKQRAALKTASCPWIRTSCIASSPVKFSATTTSVTASK
ncbi:alpha/beta fold hydrolase [Deinococcus yavapaiensis]|uniref:alpha/beta fold hydrolase n=1 Tax=Deinococcus yavapaiensis TaxID=309889 RepID=UPI001B87C070|nr:alpha/beta fold hydrolase [Deinococcus yavapaiensis]